MKFTVRCPRGHVLLRAGLGAAPEVRGGMPSLRLLVRRTDGGDHVEVPRDADGVVTAACACGAFDLDVAKVRESLRASKRGDVPVKAVLA